MSITFESLGLAPSLLQVLSQLGHTTPTPIQQEAIPLLLAGRDVLGRAQTGSGKTACFALPVLHALKPRSRLIQALVLCPTRELCTQVTREFRRLGRGLAGLQVLELAGGQPIRAQVDALQKGAHVAVGTPGRLLDHLTRGTLVLDGARTVVLDEADRMLDMGFGPDVTRVLQAAPRPRQTVLFSATFPPAAQALAREHMHNPAEVSVADTPEAAPDIRQLAFPVTDGRKDAAVLAVLHALTPERTLVFCNQKATAAEVAAFLGAQGVAAAALHGDLEQRDRNAVMARFRNQSLRVLVATDVAARGLDVPALDLVVTLDMPVQPEVHVHRVGRTGRAGHKGVAVMLVAPRDQRRVDELCSTLGFTLEPWDPRAFPALATRAEGTTTAPPAADAQMQTLWISGGRKDKVRPGDILGALTGEAGGLDGALIGKIEIHDTFSYVAVAQSVAASAVKSLQAGRIKGRRFKVDLVK
jgi:ATP-independent RNA helicase DbpA